MKEVSDIQNEILEFIKKYIGQNSYAPSVREMAKEVSLSVSSVHYHLTKLEEKGYLERGKDKPRAIKVLKQNEENEFEKIICKNCNKEFKAYIEAVSWGLRCPYCGEWI